MHNSQGLSVLVVEDDEDSAVSLATVLSLYGHIVRIATCGEDALRLAAEAMPDVALVDVRMPGLDGWETAQRLTALAAGRRPLLIAVTGCCEEDAHRQGHSVIHSGEFR